MRRENQIACQTCVGSRYHSITLIFGYRAVLCCQCDLREFTEIGIYTRFWNIWESFRDRTGRLLAGRYMVFY